MIESPWGTRFSARVQTGSGAQPASCTISKESFPGVKSGQGVTLAPHPYYCRGQERVELYLKYLSVPYRLYRASVSVQRCTLTLSIPPLPLSVVRPLQSLSACTTVHFNFTYTSNLPIGRTACTDPQCLYNGALYLYLYLYSPYRPYSLYRAPVPIQRCTLPLPIPLLPLWTVQSVQSLSACTTVHFTFA